MRKGFVGSASRCDGIIAAVVLLLLASGCGDGGNPTAPRPTNGDRFEVSGIVSNDEGLPVAGAEVTMSHWLGGIVYRPSVRTDASGRYTIAFTSSPMMGGTSGTRSAARAEIIADGYDWYWRTVVASSSSLVENFQLRRVKRIAAGESAVLSVTPANGDCIAWMYGPCAPVHVTAPANGNLTIEAASTSAAAALPGIEVCCVGGGEVGGNPVTLPVTAGMEVLVTVGQTGPLLRTSESVTVRTSFEPF